MAAQDLATHIKTLSEEYPLVPQFVVAHSHGGNVALYALRDQSVRDRVALLVTLATPFIVMRPRSLPRLLYVLMGATASVCTLVFIGALVWADVSLPALVFVTAVVAAFLIALVPVVGSAWRYRGRDFGLRSVWALRDAEMVQQELSRFDLRHAKPGKCLVVRPLGDEASGGLVTSQFLSWALAVYLRRLVSLWEWTKASWKKAILSLGLVSFLLLIGRLVVSGQTIDAIENWLGDFVVTPLGVLLSVVALVVGVLALAGAQLLLLAALPFGRDTAFWSVFAATTSESAPPGLGRVLHVDVAGTGLAHSAIYDSATAADEIADVIGPASWRPPCCMQRAAGRP